MSDFSKLLVNATRALEYFSRSRGLAQGIRHIKLTARPHNACAEDARMNTSHAWARTPAHTHTYTHAHTNKNHASAHTHTHTHARAVRRKRIHERTDEEGKCMDTSAAHTPARLRTTFAIVDITRNANIVSKRGRQRRENTDETFKRVCLRESKKSFTAKHKHTRT